MGAEGLETQAEGPEGNASEVPHVPPVSIMAEIVQPLAHFVAALKARGFTAKQIQDITAAAAEAGLVELERSQASR